MVSSYYYGLPKPGEPDPAQPVAADTPIWRHIVIRNVTATGGTKDAGLLIGLPEMPGRDIELDNVSIRAPKGLRIAYVDGISLHNVSVAADSGPPLIVEASASGLTH